MPHRILIVDDDRDLVAALSNRCTRLGLDVTAVYDARAALSSINSTRPDLICLDVTLPDGNGICFCEMLAEDKSLASIPVIILTGRGEPDVIRKCHALCAYYVPKCADLWPRLEPLVLELTASSTNLPTQAESQPASAVRIEDAQTEVEFDLTSTSDAESELARTQVTDSEQRHDPLQPPWILHIDDDHQFSRALQLRLEQHGVAVVRATGGTEGYISAFSYPADAILLDYEMPDGRGDYVLRRLKENPVTQDIPVIVLTGQKNRGLERKMLAWGAARYLVKPVRFDDLALILREYVDLLPKPAGSPSA